MDNIAERLQKACFLISAGLLVAICGIIGWQIFSRKILNDSPSWSEPLALLLLLFAVMLAAAAGVRTRLHIGLVWFRQKMAPAWQQRVQQLEALLIALLSIALLVYGWSMLATTWPYSLPGLPVAMGLQYLPLVLGGGLMLFFAMERLFFTSSRGAD